MLSPAYFQRMQAPSIFSKISPPTLFLLQEIGKFGEKTAQSVYVVGGFVRDLLIGRENLDIDIVLEGDAVRFADQLAEAWSGKVQVHCTFGTATVIRPDGSKVDFVSARNETYARPGALPSVRYSIIEADLRRRDFSINALAIRLNPDAFGELVDCTDGLRDLRAGHIRVLHDRSFIDDPTRIFRAIRYEGRYRFRIVEGDQQRIREAIAQGVLDLISGQRVRNEIDCILSEVTVPRIIRRMLEFDLFRVVHPEWDISPHFDARWHAAQQAIDWAEQHLPNDQIDTAAILWMTLRSTVCGAIKAVSDRLALENQLREKLIAQAKLCSVLDTLSASSTPSEVYRLLNPYPLEPLVFTLKQPNQPDWRIEKIQDYLIYLRGVQPLITGDDLIQLGLKPSRAFADVLWKVFAAQLDGKVSTKLEACQLLEYKT
ncbi:MAG: hypothetical protein O7E52_08840 [Candidatus Poribacteria bacterium]|nr:hypothetical protein [Candidatus Poribacteria bacterium]